MQKKCLHRYLYPMRVIKTMIDFIWLFFKPELFTGFHTPTNIFIVLFLFRISIFSACFPAFSLILFRISGLGFRIFLIVLFRISY